MATEQPPERRKFRTFTHREDIERAMMELDRLTRVIAVWSRVIVFVAFFSLCQIVIVMGVKTARLDFGPIEPSLLGTGIILPISGLIILFLWDRKVGEGRIIYEEISDEVEWKHRSIRRVKAERSVEEESQEDRPNIEVRLLLRRFLREATLPFVPGQLASSFFAMYFLCCIIFTAIALAVPLGN